MLDRKQPDVVLLSMQKQHEHSLKHSNSVCITCSITDASQNAISKNNRLQRAARVLSRNVKCAPAICGMLNKKPTEGIQQFSYKSRENINRHIFKHEGAKTYNLIKVPQFLACLINFIILPAFINDLSNKYQIIKNIRVTQH